MNKYVASVRVKGQLVKTMVFADSQLHARLILQYQFGFNNLASTPAQVSEAIIQPIKPLNPQQARLDGLKRQKETVSKQLKIERDRQKISKAQQQLARVYQSAN
ncbi:hypothetical protein G6711_02775 [Polynucleobacter paneuropaeus]|jgi:hypothetical protein|nr:hypothetical protein [Polynucleobacter paneuropaeus]